MTSNNSRQMEEKSVSKDHRRVDSDERVIINVGGFRHETLASNIRSAPDTRLHWVVEKNVQSPEYDAAKGEYFFDRNPLLFPYILNFYRTGKLHCPPEICSALFQEELQFWGIDELEIDSCCWMNFKKNQDAELNLQSLEGVDDVTESSLQVPPVNIESHEIPDRQDHQRFSLIFKKLKKLQSQLWSLLEEPHSSNVAQIAGFLSIFFIVVSVSTFCAETMPYFEDQSSIQFALLNSIETTCVIWFTIEFLARLASCPSKPEFVMNLMNWIDLCAILPYFIVLGLSSNVKTIVILRVIRLIRVFRIFKLSRHSYGLQILGHTLKSSCRELFLLVFFLSIGVVIFSSLVFYAEKDENGAMFPSIPSSFWWSIVTMTTIGYGDVVPKTLLGKLVGTLCALCGVLVIALPVPVVVSNFSLYYSHAQAKLRCSDKRRGDLNRKNRRIIGFLQPWFSAEVTHRSSIISVLSRSNYPISPPTPTSPSYRRFAQQGNCSPNHLSPMASNPSSPKPMTIQRISARNSFCGSPINSSTHAPLIITNLPSPISRSDSKKNSIGAQTSKEINNSKNIFINILPPSRQNSDQSSVTADSSASDTVFSFSPQITGNVVDVCNRQTEFTYDRSFLTPSTCTFQWSTSSSPLSESSPLTLDGYTASSSALDTSVLNTPNSSSASPRLLVSSGRMGRRNAICMVSHPNEIVDKRILQKSRQNQLYQAEKSEVSTPAAMSSSLSYRSTVRSSEINGTKSPGLSASLLEVSRRLENVLAHKEDQKTERKARISGPESIPAGEIAGINGSDNVRISVDASQKSYENAFSLESVHSSLLCRRRKGRQNDSLSDISDHESKLYQVNEFNKNFGAFAKLTSSSQSQTEMDYDGDRSNPRDSNSASNLEARSTSSTESNARSEGSKGSQYALGSFQRSPCGDYFTFSEATPDMDVWTFAETADEPQNLPGGSISINVLSSPAPVESLIEIRVDSEPSKQSQKTNTDHFGITSFISAETDPPGSFKSRGGPRKNLKRGYSTSDPSAANKAVCTELFSIQRATSAPVLPVGIYSESQVSWTASDESSLESTHFLKSIVGQ